jgi:Domain of unknown function (DUF222)
VDAVAVVTRLAGVDVAGSCRDEIKHVLRDLTGCRNWLAALEISCQTRLEVLARADPAVNPDADNAEATNRSQRSGQTASKRARTARQAPRFEQAMATGELSGEHLDAFIAALDGMLVGSRPRLLALQDRLAELACRMTVEEFREHLRREVLTIEADDGRSRLERQKAATRLRQWTDHRTGMIHLSGRFDPEAGLTLAAALQTRLETIFHAPHPQHAPDDPLERQDFLRAHALLSLISGEGHRSGAPEFIVVIDEKTLLHGRHATSRIDCGRGIHLPIHTIRDIAGRARFVPVVINRHGVVIAQGRPVPTLDELRASLTTPISLRAGRTRRFATRDQRRALRAMYRRCAIPGCHVHVSHTEPHHLTEWEHGGHTDIELLVPLCKHHHDMLHARDWQVALDPDRRLTITKGTLTVMSTGPPAHQWA